MSSSAARGNEGVGVVVLYYNVLWSHRRLLLYFDFVYATAGPTLYALKMLKPSKAVVTTHPGI